MRKLIIPFVALFAIAFAVISWKNHSTANSKDGATVIKDGGCGFYDGDGNFQLATSDQAVVTPSGNSKLTCKAGGVANSTGQAIIRTDFPCVVYAPGGGFQLTTDSRQVISAGGQMTLSCRSN